MTDNEIVKALECCIGCDCKHCPYYDGDTDNEAALCKDRLIMDALNLVNRQKAEIEEHKRAFETILKEVRAARALYIEDIGKARAEAIKEFAKRLKATFPTREDARCTLDDCYTLDIIDRIEEEMTEETT